MVERRMSAHLGVGILWRRGGNAVSTTRGEASEDDDCLLNLLARCLRNDPDAWNEFVARTTRGVALSVLRALKSAGLEASPSDVADHTQEVFLRCLANDARALREFRGATEQSLRGYLARIAVSVVADHARRAHSRKRNVRLTSIDADPAPDAPPLVETLMGPERERPDRLLDEQRGTETALRSILPALTGRHRHRDALIFALYAVDGLTAREIAELPAFDMPVAKAESIIFRTRERLRNSLRKSAEVKQPRRKLRHE